MGFELEEYFGTDIDDETLGRMADAVVRCINVKRGEAVWIRGGLHSWRLVELIRLKLFALGVTSTATMVSDWYMEKAYKEVPEDCFRLTPKEKLALAKSVDAYIAIEHPWDPTIKHGFPRSKLSAAADGFHPIREVIINERKWCYVGYPTKPMARAFGISYEELKRMIVGGMLYDPEELYRKCWAIARMLEGADTIHVTDELGTDLTLRIRGRRVNISDGFISEEDLKRGENGANLPTGEVFIAPEETWGQGTLHCPITRDRQTNKLIRGLNLVFRDGRLVVDECTADEGLEDFRKTLESHVEIDRKRYGEVRTLNVAELGIGLNERINRAIGYILTDEKIGGSIHVAIGDNKSYGGTSRSSLHWDFVTTNRETIEVTYVDGSRKVIMEDGKPVPWE